MPADLELLLEESDDFSSLGGELGKLLNVLFDGDRLAAFPAAAEVDEKSAEEKRPAESVVGCGQIDGGPGELLGGPARIEVSQPFPEIAPVVVRETRIATQQQLEGVRPFIHPDGSGLGETDGDLRSPLSLPGADDERHGIWHPDDR